MRRIILSDQQNKTSQHTTRSISFQHKRTNSERKCLTSRQTIVIKQQSKHQISSLALISKNQNFSLAPIPPSLYQTAQQKKLKDTISIQDEFSPGVYSQRTSSLYQQNMQNYVSSKKSIYKIQTKSNYQSQISQYSIALKEIVHRNDENELMDFDNRYLRSVRLKRFRDIVRFLLKKSKEQQISLQDLIDNKITQHRPYQQSGSFTFLFYVKKGMIQNVEQMLKVNPLYVHDFDEKQMTALHIATVKQNFYLIKMLLQYNANAMSKDLSGNSALNHAINQQQLETIEYFLQIQSPSDMQYLTYYNSTKNTLIKELFRRYKISDILLRCQKNKELEKYIIQQKYVLLKL